MPSGGDGFYYFSVYFRMYGALSSGFDIEINGQVICTAGTDLTESPSSDSYIISCGGAAYAVEGRDVFKDSYFYCMVHFHFCELLLLHVIYLFFHTYPR